MFRWTDRQKNFKLTTTLLTIVSSWKRDLSNNKKIWKSKHSFKSNGWTKIQKRFWCGPVKSLEYEWWLFAWKTYTRFATLGQFLRDFWSKKIFRRTDKQTLKCRIATILTTVPLGKHILSNEKEIMNTCSKVMVEH